MKTLRKLIGFLKSQEFKDFIKSNSFWTAVLVSTIVSGLLVLILGSNAATKIVGADNTSVRTLYYHVISKMDLPKEKSDEIALYNPFHKVYETDRLLQLAKELSLVAKFEPKVIVFDYILTDTLSYSPEARQAIVDAIQACLDTGIVFIATEVKNESNVSEYLSSNSFFQDPPYSLKVESGNALTDFNRLSNVSTEGESLWVPIVVSKHLLNRPFRPKSFYENRYLSFSPGLISPTHNENEEQDLRRRLTSKVVIFSDYTLGDDMHELLPFPIKGITLGLSDSKTRVSGAELLWYSVRDELEDKWDVTVSRVWVILFSFILTCFYFLLRFYIQFEGKRCGRKVLCISFKGFVYFIIFELFILSIWGFILMCFHWVFPLAMPAICLVLVEPFTPLFEYYCYEKQA